MEDSACVTMASLKQSMGFLLATQTDLRALIPSHQYPLSQTQSRMMNEFLERSIKILDVCRAIKEQIAEVEGLQGMLQVVFLCLSSKQRCVLNKGQVVRARKALGELLFNMERDREEEVSHVQLYRSFRLKSREHSGGGYGHDQRPRRGSWHGNTGVVATAAANTSGNTASQALQPCRQLQAIGAVLSPPKLSVGDVEECFCAAIYAFNVVSIFFLGTIIAALPSFNKTHIVGFAHPHFFMWASPLSQLQEKVQEELRWRGKKSNGYACMWELDQIASIVKRLFELTESDEFPLLDKTKEEIKNLVKQLGHLVEELNRDLGTLHEQITELYNRIITSRMEVLDVLRNPNP